MQEASGQGTENNTEGLNCNEINTNINSTQYSSNISCCMNKLANSQLNEINSCGIVSNVSQSNYNKQIQECILGTASTQGNDQASTLSFKSLYENAQKAITPSLIAGIIALCAICVLCIISPSIIYAIIKIFKAPKETIIKK